MIVNVKNEGNTIEACVMTSGELYGNTLYFPQKYFNEWFKELVGEITETNALRKKNKIYRAKDEIIDRIKWWTYHLAEVDFLYQCVYVNPLNNSTAYKLDMLNSIHSKYCKRWKCSFFRFCEEYKLYKKIMGGVDE